MKNLSLLIKPSSSKCDMNCTYCFYHDAADNRTIKDHGFIGFETFKNTIIKAFETLGRGNLTIAFQGGEPTLIGLDFYKKIVEFVNQNKPKEIKIHYALQTNGLSIDEEWAVFLSENEYLVGLSIDGIKRNHDIFRVDNAGRGTFERVMGTKKIFDQYNVQYNVLTVITNEIARFGKKVYQFYRKNNIDFMQFIPALDGLTEEKGSQLTPKNYEMFLKDVFDVWYQDVKWGKNVSVRYFDNLIAMYLGYPPESCDMRGICSIQNVIEADGSIYPCDFYVLDEYNLGNINEVEFKDVFNSSKSKDFIQESLLHSKTCEKCKWQKLCRNGCKKYRVEDSQLNYFCETYKNFFDYAHQRLLEIARSVRNTNK
ncbi:MULTISPECIES: anaerobic sulfatase maturase [unclassified Fusibacter]|uniref:anaerobic sulfatase maturase n=1 Tax=unclassified Fusibacter TaxID=2624464 RepID=UPI001012515E|nr:MULTISPECIES: anaerobic sulfatase maturase [unclassified Fusibacter]MCK8061619.1 anaerobic sulfatase maturase [Fusibacter sp. A2]NPE23802.1 anaerobic sulfatase maturase [Fusibacter sp. A1]RXV58640.1 anaerobic sulfatase maturase [Fusibacter sp. A1]